MFQGALEQIGQALFLLDDVAQLTDHRIGIAHSASLAGVRQHGCIRDLPTNNRDNREGCDGR
ncbi:hypothetical protein, partial [Mycobacterium parascrofulaceum]|uniref:hypothetical protein n=1 Tax=Mycobacterium parascrofulaceum TaxID=240125 RepID=UPI001FCC5A73